MAKYGDRLAKGALIAGFLGLTTAILIAYRNPATGYELSIYQSTPLSFWIGTIAALVLSVAIVFSAVLKWVRTAGALLGGIATISIVSLPLLRGYHYMGTSDSLSHLGTARDMNAGLMAVQDSLYPVVHVLSSFLHDVSGIALHHTMVFLVVVFVACFLLFVPLVVRQLTADRWAAAIGLFSGILLLPLNHLSPSLYIHPTSQAIMFSPVLIFIFVALYRVRSVRNSLAFLTLATTFVLLHPQQAANLVLFFGTIAGLQIGYDVIRRSPTDRWREWVAPEVAIFTAFFAFWVARYETFWSHLERTYEVPFTETQAAESTATRSISLEQVGGSLPEVFAKLFGVTLIYVLLTALLGILVVRSTRSLSSRLDQSSIVTDGGSDRMLMLYIFGGLIAIGSMFVVFLVGGISDQYFRHLGMLMVFATILGAIAIRRAVGGIFRGHNYFDGRQVIVIFLLLCIALSVPVIFASPYMYAESDQVTEKQMSGYETTFEHQDRTIAFDHVRQATDRYADATVGRDRAIESYQASEEGIPDHFANRSLRTYYNETTYIPVPEFDRIRDPILWDGFRFNHSDFDYLESEQGINKVHANGGYDLYVVRPASNSTATVS